MQLDYKKFEIIIKNIDRIFNDPDQYGNLYNIERNQAEVELNLYSELKNKAALGEIDARKYLINKYSILIRQIFDLNDEKIDEFINFKELQDNNIEILFEMLLEVFDISELIEKYELPTRILEKDIRKIAEMEKDNMKAYFSLPNKVRLLALIVYSREYGQDIIDSLQHHNINEIGVIDKDYIYIVHKGVKIHLQFLHFRNNSIIENIQKKTTQNSTTNYDRQNPTVVAAKNNSSRITVAGFDITPTEEDLYYNERIFNLKKITLEEMRDNYNTINELIFKFLSLNQKGRGSHFVTGSDMGVGKSTFLLAMMEKVPDKWGIGILDTQNELQAKKKYPWKNILTLLVNTKRTIAQCFEFMLKTARDVLYVGEITMPGEVAELINASLRLNSGVGATMHSLSPFEVVTNVRNLMMRTEMYNDANLAEADIARGLDLIIHLSKLDSGRIIVENIIEVQYVELDNFKLPILEGTYKDRLSNLIDMAQLALQKYLYSKRYRYNEIIKYDHDKQKWISMNLPTERYFEKIGKYVSQKDIEEIKGLFRNGNVERGVLSVSVFGRANDILLKTINIIRSGNYIYLFFAIVSFLIFLFLFVRQIIYLKNRRILTVRKGKRSFAEYLSNFLIRFSLFNRILTSIAIKISLFNRYSLDKNLEYASIACILVFCFTLISIALFLPNTIVVWYIALSYILMAITFVVIVFIVFVFDGKAKIYK